METTVTRFARSTLLTARIALLPASGLFRDLRGTVVAFGAGASGGPPTPPPRPRPPHPPRHPIPPKAARRPHKPRAASSPNWSPMTFSELMVR
ncbi:4-fold beta flower protein [Microbacterium sp. zg.B48]|uniref:4-fold beta flower protein n=1 Tax=Microbacterium sp. zg.B48 TaxID=2969408 RepID=UPI0035A89BA3